jgi:predicted Zn-dependent protease with MMP-like domain
MATFRKEVRLTYLHELGHYLGWDEDQVAAHGLE